MFYPAPVPLMPVFLRAFPLKDERLKISTILFKGD
jgi:hypothetical protein